MAPHSTAGIHLLFLRTIYFVFGEGGEGVGHSNQVPYFGLFLLHPTAFKHC